MSVSWTCQGYCKYTSEVPTFTHCSRRHDFDRCYKTEETCRTWEMSREVKFAGKPFRRQQALQSQAATIATSVSILPLASGHLQRRKRAVADQLRVTALCLAVFRYEMWLNWRSRQVFGKCLMTWLPGNCACNGPRGSGVGGMYL